MQTTKDIILFFILHIYYEYESICMVYCITLEDYDVSELLWDRCSWSKRKKKLNQKCPNHHIF